MNAYHIVDLPRISSGTEYPVYLIDTPGFSDNEVSEMEIIDMVRQWFKERQYVLVLIKANGISLN